MNLNNFMQDFSDDIQKALLAKLNARTDKRRTVVFDADGTLWKHDMGEELLRRHIAENRLIGVDYSKDILAEYKLRVKKNKTDGYCWATQLMAGLHEHEVINLSRKLAREWPYYREPMRKLVRAFNIAEFEVWVFSASNIWLIREAAPYMGISPKKSFGLEVEIKNKILTDKIKQPVTSEAGKTQAILKWIGQAPDIAVGDSFGDLQMLEMAQEFPLIIGDHNLPDDSFHKLARDRGWFVQFF